MTKFNKSAVAALAVGFVALSAGAAELPVTSDIDQTKLVLAALAQDSALQADQLRVGIDAHIVYLRGTVDTEVERHDAGELALKIPGVAQVVNNIDVANN